MKKLLLSVLGLSAMIATSNAQIFSESFDTDIPATWTIIDVDGLTSTSAQSAYASWAWNSGVQDASSSSWYNNSGAGPTNDWLITPGIAVPASGTFQLEYDGASHEASYLEEYEILYSTTGNTVADFTAAALLSIVNEPNVATAHAIVLPAATAGQTVYIAFHHTSQDESMLHIDNVIVRQLLQDDAEMTSLNVASYVTAGNQNITGVITNQGANTITAMDIVWDDGSGPQTDNLTGLSISAGSSYNFTHATPLSVAAGTSYAVDVSVALTGDGNAANNALTANVAGLTQIPAKVVVGEEKTGTWCGWCPRGAVGLAGMESTPSFIGIAVHNADPMAITSYDNGTAANHPDFTGYPHGAVDRAIGGDPSSFNTMHSNRVNAIVPCDVKNIVAVLNQSTNQITVSADAEFYGNITGEYRMSCVIVEDDIATTGAGWSQVNYYSGGGSGSLVDPVSGFNWSTSTDPVVPTAFGGYDHVARSLSNNSIMGDAGSLTMNPGIGVQNYTFADVASSVINDVAKSHAIVMIVNATTSEILNAGSATISISTSTSEISDAKFGLNVYPNPTVGNAEINFNLTTDNNVKMEIYNAMGSLVYTEAARDLAKGNHKLLFDGSELTNGFYFVNLTIGDNVISKKVTLTK